MKLVGNTNPSGKGMNGNVFDSDFLCPTLTTNKGEGIKILIKNATKKGYLIAEDGDGIDTAYPESKTRRGRVQKNMAHTITTAHTTTTMDIQVRYQVQYGSTQWTMLKIQMVASLSNSVVKTYQQVQTMACMM